MIKNLLRDADCSHCKRKISQERYVQCVQCLNYCLCLQCFSVCHNHPIHLRDHKMIILDGLPVTIFDDKWTTNDEIILLSSLRTLGFGNWPRIQALIPSKKQDEIEQHYIQVYLESPTAPLPKKNFKKEVIIPPPPPFNTEPQASNPSLARQNGTSLAEIYGYMPFRHEWDVESSNDAELLVVQLSFTGKESLDEFKNKIQSLELYNFVLKDRQFRTSAIEEWCIQGSKEWLKLEDEKDMAGSLLGAQTEEEKKIDSLLVPLAPFVGVPSVKRMSKVLHERIHVIEKIEKLKIWQANGVKTYEEGELFLKLKSLISNGEVNDSDMWNKLILNYKEGSQSSANSDVDFLSRSEIEFCKNLQINGQVYLAIKDLLIREFTVRGSLSDSLSRKLCPENEEIVSAIRSFLCDCGMIR